MKDKSKPPNSENQKKSYRAKLPLHQSFKRLWDWLRGNKLGAISLFILILLVIIAAFADFLSPYSPNYIKNKVPVVQPDLCQDFPGLKECQQEDALAIYAPLTKIHFFDADGFSWPYVCTLKSNGSGTNLAYQEDCTQRYPIKFFVHNSHYEYKLLGLFKTNVHLFGATKSNAPLFFSKVSPEGSLFILGTDGKTRDLLSRILMGTRASLGISLIAVFLSLVIALPIGGLSGYFGGVADTFIQRIIEAVLTFPRLAILLVLVVAFQDPNFRLSGMILLLAFFNAASVSRILRGQVLKIREANYIEAVRAQGAGHGRILLKHILPQTTSTITVSTTFAIPNLLMLESFLSYLGYGVPETIPSWGILLKEIGEVHRLPLHPWILFPGLAITLTVLACTFLGDALRDWYDPFRKRVIG